MNTKSTSPSFAFDPTKVLEATTKFQETYYVGGYPIYSPHEMAALMGYMVADMAIISGKSDDFLQDFFISLEMSFDHKTAQNAEAQKNAG